MLNLAQKAVAHFSEDIIAEATDLVITEDLLSNRPVAEGITIDSAESRDLDDAIWLESTSDVHVVHVSISDVAALITPGMKLYDEAVNRIATEYRAAYNVPMLPKVLSEDRLSLMPLVARPTITFSISLNTELEPTGLSFRRTVLRSKGKFSYSKVDRIIDNGEGEPERDVLRSCYALALHLMHKRRSKGALVVYDLVKRVYTTEEGILVPLEDEHAHKANIIVQEMMILCNSAVAHFMAAQGVPFLFRNHTVRPAAPHREEIIEQLNTALIHPRLLDAVRQRSALWFNKATYDTVLKGHFGLNEVAYTHITSPLRRAPDLINHQVISAYLDGRTMPYEHDHLASMSASINKRLANAQDAARRYHKERSLAETQARASAAKVEQFIAMAAQEFQRVLKQAVMMPTVPDGIERGIEARLQRKSLGAEHLYTLLFATPRDIITWQQLRTQCLAYLHAHPDYATSLVHMHAQDGRLEGMRIDVVDNDVRIGSGFAARVVTVQDEREVSAPAYGVGSSKKQAQHNACLLFLRHYLDGTLVPAEHTQIMELPQDRSIMAAQPPPALAEAAVESGESLGQVVQESPEENYVGTLGELRSKRPHWRALEYKFVQRGASHQPVITCTCLLDTGGNTLETTAEAASKKAAKQISAAKMLELVAHEPEPEAPPVAEQPPTVRFGEVPVDDNYVGRLEELCTQHRISQKPVYEYHLSGPAHQPIVKCTATMTVEGYDLSADGIASTKKDAKQVAACKLFRMLEAAPPRTPASDEERISEENNVGRLIELARERKWREPLFDVESSGSTNLPLFTCTCRLKVEDEWLEVKDSAWKKQASRHAAARAMIELLKQQTDLMLPEGMTSTDDSVTALTNLCMERGLPLPRLNFEEWKNTAAPTYTCRASIKVGEKIIKAHGVGNARPVALEAACRELMGMVK